MAELEKLCGELIEQTIELRDALRQAQYYILADMIRSDYAKMGIILEDTPMGTRWYRKPKRG